MLIVGDDDDVQAIPLFGLVTRDKNPTVRGDVSLYCAFTCLGDAGVGQAHGCVRVLSLCAASETTFRV